MVAAMERDTHTTHTVLLDPDQKSPRAAEFEDKLASRIVGQERAVRRMSGLYQIFLAGMNPPNRPGGPMLFLGPTGARAPPPDPPLPVFPRRDNPADPPRRHDALPRAHGLGQDARRRGRGR